MNDAEGKAGPTADRAKLLPLALESADNASRVRVDSSRNESARRTARAHASVSRFGRQRFASCGAAASPPSPARAPASIDGAARAPNAPGVAPAASALEDATASITSKSSPSGSE